MSENTVTKNEDSTINANAMIAVKTRDVRITVGKANIALNDCLASRETSTGAVSLTPCSRKAMKDRHDLTGSQAKWLHRQVTDHLKTVQAGVIGALSSRSDFTGLGIRQNAKGDRISFTFKQELPPSEPSTSKAKVEKLAAENDELKRKLDRMEEMLKEAGLLEA